MASQQGSNPLMLKSCSFTFGHVSKPLQRKDFADTGFKIEEVGSSVTAKGENCSPVQVNLLLDLMDNMQVSKTEDQNVETQFHENEDSGTSHHIGDKERAFKSPHHPEERNVFPAVSIKHLEHPKHQTSQLEKEKRKTVGDDSWTHITLQCAKYDLAVLKFTKGELKDLLQNKISRKGNHVMVSLPSSELCEELNSFIKHVHTKKIPIPKTEEISSLYTDLETKFKNEAIFQISDQEIIVTGLGNVIEKVLKQVHDKYFHERNQTQNPDKLREINAMKRKSCDQDGNSRALFKGAATNLKVEVSVANITEMDVDVIVNAANSRLKHGGGVAKAISKAAGLSLKDECDRFIRLGGTLNVADIFVSSGGDLRARKVYHAIGPKWENYSDIDKQLCEEHLRYTVLRCLTEASKQRIHSIAFPSISAAIFKVPKITCAESYMKAVKHFDCLVETMRLPSVPEIHFVDIDKEMVNTIQDTFNNKWLEKPKQEEMDKDEIFMTKCLKNEERGERRSRHQHFGTESSEKHQAHTGAESRGTSTKREEEKRRMKSYKYGKYKLIVQVGHALDMAFSTSSFIMFFGNELKHIYSQKPLSERDISLAQGFSNIYYYDAEVRKYNASEAQKSPLIIHLSQFDLHDFKRAFQILPEVISKCCAPKTVLCDKESFIVSSDLLYQDYSEGQHVFSKQVRRFAKDCYDVLKKLSNIKGFSSKTVYIVVGNAQTLADVQGVFDTREDMIADSKQEVGRQSPFAKEIGNMPDGSMSWKVMRGYVLGFLRPGFLEIMYHIPAGTQNKTHPHPGQRYESLKRLAYLPDTKEGKEILLLLGLAFLRRLTFTFAQHSTHSNSLTWNGIHHKISCDSSHEKYGYPDPNYLPRLKQQLAERGVMLDTMSSSESTKIQMFKETSSLSNATSHCYWYCY